MKLLIPAAIIVIVWLAYLVWRTMMRSPKLDQFFDSEKKDTDTYEFLEEIESARQGIKTRASTLAKKRADIEDELDYITRPETKPKPRTKR